MYVWCILVYFVWCVLIELPAFQLNRRPSYHESWGEGGKRFVCGFLLLSAWETMNERCDADQQHRYKKVRTCCCESTTVYPVFLQRRVQ